MNSNLPILIIGGGGHSKVLVDILKLQNLTILGISDLHRSKLGKKVLEIPIIGDDSIILKYSPNDVQLANGIGAVLNNDNRKRIFKYFKKLNFSFVKCIHPSSVISSSSHFAEGVQIMAGTVVQADTHVGKNTIINTRTSIDHDCRIGDNVHIAPGVTINGAVNIKNNVLVGAGSTVLHNLTIGENSIIGAGSVVIDDVPNNVKIVGVPARLI